MESIKDWLQILPMSVELGWSPCCPLRKVILSLLKCQATHPVDHVRGIQMRLACWRWSLYEGDQNSDANCMSIQFFGVQLRLVLVGRLPIHGCSQYFRLNGDVDLGCYYMLAELAIIWIFMMDKLHHFLHQKNLYLWLFRAWT